MQTDDLKAISIHQIAQLIPLPASDANKYSRGVLAIIGGATTYPGAAVLAASAAQRMGAGYTQVWCAPESVSDVRAGHASLVVRPWNAMHLNGRETALVVGCGFENGGEQEQALLASALKTRCALVVDGAGLTALAEFVCAGGTDFLAKRAGAGLPLVLTPHAGEAQRLAQAIGAAQTGECFFDQAQLAAVLGQAYCATVVLKGPKTVIYGVQQGAAEGYVMNQGTAALAKAGTGDVLAGIIGALLCQGLSGVQAGCLGSSLHAHAGHLAAQELTAVSVTPEDVVAYLPRALKDYLALRA